MEYSNKKAYVLLTGPHQKEMKPVFAIYIYQNKKKLERDAGMKQKWGEHAAEWDG